MTPIDRNDLIERDLQSHAKTIIELTMRMPDYEKDQAVREVKDEHLEERFERIEDRVQAIYKLGLWILAAFGGSFIALVANFVFRGVLIAP
jgi:hypothetical protein